MRALGRFSVTALHCLFSLAALSCNTYVASGLPTKAADGGADARFVVEPDGTLVPQHGMYPNKMSMDVASEGGGERHHGTPDASVVEEHIRTDPHAAARASVTVESDGFVRQHEVHTHKISMDVASGGDGERHHGTPDASVAEFAVEPDDSLSVRQPGVYPHKISMDVASEGDGERHHGTPDASFVEEHLRTDPHAAARASVAVEPVGSGNGEASVAVEPDGTSVRQHGVYPHEISVNVASGGDGERHHGTPDASVAEVVAVEPDGTKVRQHGLHGQNVWWGPDGTSVRQHGVYPQKISMDDASGGDGERRHGTPDASVAQVVAVESDGTKVRQHGVDDQNVWWGPDGTSVRQHGAYPHKISMDVASGGDGERHHGRPDASVAEEHIRTDPPTNVIQDLSLAFESLKRNLGF